MNDCPPMVYGTNVRTGDCVSYRPCDECQICKVAPWSAPLNGSGMERSADDHSSFDRPATSRLPLTYDMSVMVIIRGSWRALGLAAGASVRLTAADLMLSRATLVTWPLALTLTIIAAASGPWPRVTERYTFFDSGFTFTS